MPESMFEGLKVADFTAAIAGPMSTRYLACEGATVIKVECHSHPDSVRLVAPFKDMVPGYDRSSQFAAYNYSKKSIGLDLGQSNGREVAMRLVKWADVVIENMAPGVLEKWGLDYQGCRKERPDVIYLSSSSLGRTGPLSSFAAWGYHHGPLVGVSHMTGWPDRLPCLDALAYTDTVAPSFTVIALMGALLYRRRTGKGVFIDQSQTEAGAYVLGPVIMDYLVNGRTAIRAGNRDPDMAPHGVFPCRGEEKWVAIAVKGEAAWVDLCRVLGKQDWCTNEKFATLSARKDNEDELEHLISDWTIQQSRQEVVDLLQSAGVAAGIVASNEDLFNDPQLKHRGHFGKLDHEEVGTHSYELPASRFSKMPHRKQTPAPLLGEHTDYVLGELLGYTDDQITELLIEGTITTDDDLPDLDSN